MRPFLNLCVVPEPYRPSRVLIQVFDEADKTTAEPVWQLYFECDDPAPTDISSVPDWVHHVLAEAVTRSTAKPATVLPFPAP